VAYDQNAITRAANIEFDSAGSSLDSEHIGLNGVVRGSGAVASVGVHKGPWS
jgi:hypothetical protein